MPKFSDTSSTPAAAAAEIRRAVGNASNFAEFVLTQLRQIVQRHGRAAIAAELTAGEATRLLALYDLLKSFRETEAETVVPALP